MLAGWGTAAAPEIAVAHAVAAAAWGALAPGPYPLVKLSELVLSASWEDRVRFLPLLADAARRGLLRPAGAGYQFRDDGMLALLAASGEAALAGLARRQAGNLAGRDVRAVTARGLTRVRIMRVSADAGLGAAGATAAVLMMTTGSSSGSAPWISFPFGVVVGAFVGLVTAAAVYWLLTFTVRGSAASLAYLPLTSRRSRLLAGAAALTAAAVLVALAGPALARAVAFVLPAALVAACGGWACALAYHWTRSRSRRWQRAAPDLIAAVTAGSTLYVLGQHRLVTAAPAAGLLFPVAGWGAFLVWRTMNGSARVAVRAAADLVLALLLGGEIVLLLVWLANVLAMPRGEVAAVRAVLGRAGELADLPWWAWTGTWLGLAAASLAFVRWPGRLKKAAQRFQRWQVAAVAEVERARADRDPHRAAGAGVRRAGRPAGPHPAAQPAAAGRLRRGVPARAAGRRRDGRLYRALPAAGRPAALTGPYPAGQQDSRDQPACRLGQASDTEQDNARRVGEAQAAALALASPALA